MKVKCCLAGILLLLVLVKSENPKKAEQDFMECIKEAGITNPPVMISTDDAKGRCFLACRMKKDGTMIDGKARADKVIEISEKRNPKGMDDSSKAILIECADKANKEEDECELVGVLYKCYGEKSQISKKQP